MTVKFGKNKITWRLNLDSSGVSINDDEKDSGIPANDSSSRIINKAFGEFVLNAALSISICVIDRGKIQLYDETNSSERSLFFGIQPYLKLVDYLSNYNKSKTVHTDRNSFEIGL